MSPLSARRNLHIVRSAVWCKIGSWFRGHTTEAAIRPGAVLALAVAMGLATDLI